MAQIRALSTKLKLQYQYKYMLRFSPHLRKISFSVSGLVAQIDELKKEG